MHLPCTCHALDKRVPCTCCTCHAPPTSARQAPHSTPLSQLAADAAPETLKAAVAAGDVRAYGFAGSRVLALQMHPFKLEMYEGGKLVAVANGDNKFYFEHHRSRDDNG